MGGSWVIPSVTSLMERSVCCSKVLLQVFTSKQYKFVYPKRASQTRPFLAFLSGFINLNMIYFMHEIYHVLAVKKKSLLEVKMSRVPDEYIFMYSLDFDTFKLIIRL